MSMSRIARRKISIIRAIFVTFDGLALQWKLLSAATPTIPNSSVDAQILCLDLDRYMSFVSDDRARNSRKHH